MPKSVVVFVALSLLGVAVHRVEAQVQSAPSGTAQADHLVQLRTCREGIVDLKARSDDRRRFAELMVSYNTPQANAMIVDLLGHSTQPDVQRAMCQVLSDRARQTPERIDLSFIEPLITLLGADAEDLRALAALALAEAPATDLPARLGAIAARKETPLPKRLAAIDALAPNTHRRDVVGQLIRLLEAGVPQINERVVAVLEPLTPTELGSEAGAWQAWWRSKSRMTEDSWLADQLQIQRDRIRRRDEELRDCRGDLRKREDALSARLRDFEREVYRLSGEQREIKLIEWLNDPLPAVKRTALAIIRARIADEGKRPDGDLLAAMLGLLKQPSPELKQEVLDVVKNLNETVVVDTLLMQLEKEQDPTTRVAYFKAIGHLNSPEAIPALVQELAEPKSSTECVAEAALALGQVAPKSSSQVYRDEAVAALKECYRSAPPDQSSLRAALLNAMAGVAARAFSPVFLTAIDSDDRNVVREAIRGLRAVEDSSKLPRLRTLAAHQDPLVRIEAIESVGRLGREDADLESLLVRLSPTIEPNETARQAAWRAVREFLTRRPMRERIQAAQRLRDYPELETELLAELARAMTASNGLTAEAEPVLDRLATLLGNQGRHTESATHLRSLYEARLASRQPGAMEIGRRLLAARLRSGEPSAVTALIRQLAETATDDEEKTKLAETIADFTESDEIRMDPGRTRGLLNEFKSIDATTMGHSWENLLERFASRVEAMGEDSKPNPQPAGNQPRP